MGRGVEDAAPGRDVPPLIRQLLSVAVLPFTVTVLVPIWIARSYGATFSVPETSLGWISTLVSVSFLLGGFTVFLACVLRFADDGRGTLAPWDPPTRLVIRGPYRWVRNPMITGVSLLLLGEGLALRSLPHFVWAGCFIAANAIYIPLFEEPGLAERFGDDYRRYCERVPRLVPLLRPWRADGEPPAA